MKKRKVKEQKDSYRTVSWTKLSSGAKDGDIGD